MNTPLVDASERTISSRIFTDPAIFAREQATVFAESWLYVGHRSQFSRPGDFIQAYAGTLPIVVCRNDNDQFSVIANVCSHRGSRICQPEFGHAEKFVCPYHNWVFDNRGDLVSVPRRSSPDFDKAKWHLLRADRVATYRDLIFATFSAEAVSLEDYLGEMKWYLDLLIGAGRTGTEVSAGTHRSLVHCNWKIPAEQFGSDNWHFQGVHGSMSRLGRRNEDPASPDSFHVWTKFGHMLICVAPKTEFPSAFTAYLNDRLAKEQISPLQRRLLRCSIVLTIFPNLSIVFFPGLCSIRVWHPRAPGETELWSWALYDADAPHHIKDLIRKQVTRMFSPTGMLEQDDLEVWARLADNLTRVPPDYRLCYAFTSGEDILPRDFPGNTASLQSDGPAFQYYSRWADVLAQGENWRHAE